MELIKFLPVFFVLVITACSTTEKKSGERTPSLHIGGSSPAVYIPAVRLGAERVISSCTAVFVSTRHLLTAAHCISTDPAVLSGKTKTPTPFTDEIALLEENGNYKSLSIEVVSVELYPAHYFKDVLSKLNFDSELEAIKSLLAAGDFAIIEIRDPVSESFVRKVLFESKASNDLVWVGGYGLKNRFWHPWSDENYTGSFAKFGAERNAFSYSDLSLSSQTEVSIELRDAGTEITYLYSGDSGGAVFKTIGETQYVVAVNHTSPVITETILMKPGTNRVQDRPAKKGDLVGFAHRFSSKNQRLKSWIKSVLPAASFEIK